ncbi:hypothetical protein B0H63DRAFT_516668 [Podospora didyma]|uniref:Uncharacterized protein n=1 Tax=Podospora didyma TaxID=330526 RepID=A0AAE0P5R3_9PEZI|nr:hypothetical protein B0H63DRAFT_516668 [Podospora didyma]
MKRVESGGAVFRANPRDTFTASLLTLHTGRAVPRIIVTDYDTPERKPASSAVHNIDDRLLKVPQRTRRHSHRDRPIPQGGPILQGGPIPQITITDYNPSGTESKPLFGAPPSTDNRLLTVPRPTAHRRPIREEARDAGKAGQDSDRCADGKTVTSHDYGYRNGYFNRKIDTARNAVTISEKT